MDSLALRLLWLAVIFGLEMSWNQLLWRFFNLMLFSQFKVWLNVNTGRKSTYRSALCDKLSLRHPNQRSGRLHQVRLPVSQHGKSLLILTAHLKLPRCCPTKHFSFLVGLPGAAAETQNGRHQEHQLPRWDINMPRVCVCFFFLMVIFSFRLSEFQG